MKVIDLFCGVGGLSLGFEKAGFDVVAGVDFWEDAINTFNHNHRNNNGIVEDIKKFNTKHLPQILAKIKLLVLLVGHLVKVLAVPGFLTVVKKWAKSMRKEIIYILIFLILLKSLPNFFD